MAKMKHLKKSLLASSMALVMSASALVGTTFAWFTDSVASANNIIKSGNLDVDVYYGDPTQEKSIAGVDTLFNSVKLWEPGAVAYENLTVANVGSLALKYEMSVNFINENYVVENGVNTYCLSDILQVGLVYGGVDTTDTREEVIADVDQWLPMIDFKFTNGLDPYTNEETVGIVIYWEVSDEDNNYNVNNGKQTSDGEKFLHIDLGINLVATQNTVETDGFDNQYDKEATFPVIASGTLQEGASEGLTLKANRVTVTVPQGAPAGTYTLELNSFDVQGETLGENDLNTNIALKKDGVNVAPDSAVYNVTIELQPMVDILGVTHNGENVATYTYDVFKNDISFNTTSFSPFAIEYDVFGTALKLDVENRKILGGFFTKDPTTEGLDPSLLDSTSEYIIVNHERNGETCHIITERATTYFLIPEGDNAKISQFTNAIIADDNIKVVTANNLYSIISGLQGNEHSTVYILEGEYTANTAINVYSSMDIIGLGKKENIKITKVKGSYSNRHLFNVNGAVTREEHIQVNFYNLTLDASAKNLNSAGKLYTMDNAAVQSIRLSKTKCYDLHIIKSGGFAFYVNGKYDSRGAYLYAENCTMTTSSVVDTAAPFLFYYNNIKYSNGTKTYTNNTSSIKNIKMASNDWEW